MEQSEDEHDQHRPAAEHGVEDVDGGDRDRERDDRLDDLGVNAQDAERRQRKRDRVRHGERGNDLEHLDQSGAERLTLDPALDRDLLVVLAPPGAPHDGCQEQHDQEQDVVGADQDVLDSLVDELLQAAPDGAVR
ncbi:MAG: hypothetical protein AAFZ87_12790, partial [Planctomycetota bacterium]